LAVVGPSGAGKSTLVNLLLRFWDYEEGHIYLGGHELRSYHQDDVRRLIGVISQRLVRRICPHCKTEYTPAAELIKEFFETPPDDIKWVKGRGCKECHFTGFHGRLPLAELWEPSNQDILLINKQAPTEELKKSARQSTIPIMEEAMLKLKAGETTLNELIRVLPYSFISDFRAADA